MNHFLSEIPVCTVCSENNKIILKDKTLNIFYCSVCSHSFTMGSKNEREEYSESYFTGEHENWFVHPNLSLYNHIYAAIKNNFPNKNVKVMDAGCGNGNFLKFLNQKNKNFELHGIDLTKNQYEGINFFQGDFFGFQTEKKFDVVVCLGTIEHIENPNLFVQKIFSHLETNGMTVIMTINNNSLIYRIARLLKKIGFGLAYDRLYSLHHLQHFSNNSLNELLKRNGFEIFFHKNHNYPTRSVDVPAKNAFVKFILVSFVTVLFTVSYHFGLGQLQTVISKKQK